MARECPEKKQQPPQFQTQYQKPVFKKKSFNQSKRPFSNQGSKKFKSRKQGFKKVCVASIEEVDSDQDEEEEEEEDQNTDVPSIAA